MRDKINETLKWADAKGILEFGTIAGQFKKFIEEAGEVGEALINNNGRLVVDSIGDTLVTLIILAELNGVDVEYCLQAALDEIKDRKGKMVDGVFVKEAS